MLGITSTVSVLAFWMFLMLLWTAALTSGEDQIKYRAKTAPTPEQAV